MRIAMARVAVSSIAFWAFSNALADARPFYQNDFQKDVGSEWSCTITDTAPNPALSSWGRYLGQFSGNQSVTLSLAEAPKGRVKLTFDTYFIRSWDGNGDSSAYGPDYFSVSGNGSTLLRDTFSNGNPAGQSYVGNGVAAPAYYGSSNTSMTGSREQFSLGYYFWDGIHGKKEAMDSIYTFELFIYNSERLLEISFSGEGLQDNWLAGDTYNGLPYYDESWGLDNVRLEAIPTPEPSSFSLLFFGVCAFLAPAVKRLAKNVRC